MSKKTYRLRNRQMEVLGEASEKDLLKRIERGKFTGEEEVAVAPFNQWQKLSSHPVFYDAFLKRLYRDKYPIESVEEKSEEKSKKQKTKRRKSEAPTGNEQALTQNLIEIADASPDVAKTSHIPEEKAGGGTLHQSVIRDLFTQSKSQAEKPVEPIGSGLVAIEAEGVEPTLKLSEPLDHAGKAFTEELPEAVLAKRGREKRRRLVLAGGIAALLALLFQMGGQERNTPIVATGPKQGIDHEIRELIQDTSGREDRIRILVEEGDRLNEAGTPLFYAGSQELFNEALAHDEANAIIIGRLAEATARLLPESRKEDGLEGELKDLLKRGRTLDPQYNQFYRAEALLELHTGNLAGAKQAITNATEADPPNTENYLVSGEILYHAKEYDAAKAALNEVIQVIPGNVRARHYLALIHMANRDFAKAETESINVLKVNPIHSDSYRLLALIALEQGRHTQARQLLDTSVGLAPFGTKFSVAEAHLLRASLLRKEGNDKEADKSVQLAYYYASELPRVREEIKGLDTSEKTLRELARQSEYARTYFGEQAENLIAQKKHRESMLFLQAAYLLDPTNGQPLVRLGEVAEKLATSYLDFRTVVGYFQRAIIRDPTLTQAYVKLGLLEAEQYNLDRAYRLLKQAETLAPQESEPYVALGKYYYLARDPVSSVELFKKANDINRKDSETHYYLGLLRLQGKKGAEKEAAQFFYSAYLLDSTNYDALIEWLHMKVALSEKTFAILFVKNLMAQDPKNAAFFWAMGEIYASSKEYRRAISYYHQSLDLDNRSSRVRMSLGRALEAVGETDTAVDEYIEASKLDRRNGDGFYKAAELLFQSKKIKESEQVLRRLVSLSPNYPGVHRTLARVLQAQNKRDLALAEIRQEVTNNPMNYKYRIELSEMLMDYGLFDQAITELREVTNLPSSTKASQFAFEKQRAYLLLSRCLRAHSQFESAEAAIRLALETDAEDPELHRELGYVYHGLQRDREAVKAFEFYLNRNPAAQDVETIKSLIQNLQIEE